MQSLWKGACGVRTLCTHSGRVHVGSAPYALHSLWKGACEVQTICSYSRRVHVECTPYALWKGTCKQYDFVGSHLYFINLEKCYFSTTASKLNWLLYNEKLLVNLTLLCHVLALARSCLCQEPSLPAHCLLQPLSPDTSLLFGKWSTIVTHPLLPIQPDLGDREGYNIIQWYLLVARPKMC